MRALAMRSYIVSTPLVAAIAIGGAACGQGGQETDSETGTIRGDVADEEGQSFAPQQVEGAVVTAHRVDANGELQVVATESATVSADGSYELEVDAGASADAALVVEASSEAEGELIGRAAVSESFDGEAEMVAPTIDGEATAIADLYVEARVSGSVSADVGPGMFWLVTGSQLATELAAAGKAELEAAAEAAASATAAWKAALEHESTGAADQDIGMALQLSAEAEAELAARLADGDRQAALEAYSQAVLSAHADAGIQAHHVSRAAIASAEVMAAYAGEVGGDAEVGLHVAAEAHKARFATAALVARAESEVSASAASAIDGAGATLRGEIEAAAAAGADAEAEIDQAWADFRAEAEAELAAALEVAEAEIETVVAAMDESASTLADALADLSGTIAIGSNVDVAVTGIAEFFAAVEVQVDVLVELGVSETQAQAAVEILATAVACGG